MATKTTANQHRYVSTKQAAKVLDVSVSTVKRWVDTGVLPAHKTAGGHRKLLLAEVVALARQNNLPQGEELVLTSAEAPTPDELRGKLIASLLSGNAAMVQSLLHQGYRGGLAIETLADQVISPALTEVGHCWETEKIDVWHEHRATQFCLAPLFELKADLEKRAERDRPIALGAAPEGDPYQMASLLAQLVLIDAGWNAINLGPNTPFASLTRSMHELRPRLIWVSASFLADVPRFVSEYRVFFREADAHNIPVAIGGQAMMDCVRASIPYTTFGDGLTHLAAFAKTLHPRPRPPRRGRPPKA